MKNRLSSNDKAYERWKANGGKGQFIAIIDGDDVTEGSDFKKVALDASELASQRGKNAKITIYDSSSDTKISH